MFILKGVNIPLNGRWKKQEVAIHNGLFSEISDHIVSLDINSKDIKIISMPEEKYLIPAMIDPHVHVREPGFVHKEDWTSCSKAALKGGVGAIIDMPNNKSPVDDLEKIKEKINIANRKSYVNYGLYIALTDDNADKIANGVFEDYICGVKIYMAKTTGGLIVDSSYTIKKVFYQNRPVLAHTGGKKGLLKLLRSYEDVYTEKKHVPILYVCHVSTAEEVDILRDYKRSLPYIKAEVTPHHLFLNRDDYNGPSGVLPPLGSKKDQSALWDGLMNETIDFIGTDHAPHALQEKLSENPPSGFPGLETALPLIFDSMMDGKISLNKLIEITSFNVAKTFNLGEYGKIEKNMPANCTLIVKKNWEIGEDGYQTKCNWSPFAGKMLSYKIYLTIVNGCLSYFDGEYHQKPIKQLCSNEV